MKAILALAAVLVAPGVVAAQRPAELTYSLALFSHATPIGAGICVGEGRRAVRVTDPATDRGAAWSPDGSRIAFSRAVARGRFDVFVADAAGLHLHDLTRGYSNASIDPDWSPDGRRIAFVAGARLVVMNADGSGKHDVVTGIRISSPSWSPDGARLAYSGSGKPGGVYVVAFDGGPSTLVAERGSEPDWSPDGREIAFSRGGSGAVVGAVGGDARVVADPAVPEDFVRGPAWSPDGKEIAWELASLAGDEDVVVSPSEGGEWRTVRSPAGLAAAEPAWRRAATLPDGRPCVVRGTGRGDLLVGTARGDAIAGGAGTDTIRGLGGNDLLIGGPDQDRLFGGAGNDRVDARDDVFYPDLVDGGPGRDRALYDAGVDRLRSIELR